MGLVRKSILDRVEIDRAGNVGLRFVLQVVVDDEVVAEKFHRTIVPTGVDPVSQMGLVNEHLAQMGEAPVPESEIDKLRSFDEAAKAVFADKKV